MTAKGQLLQDPFLNALRTEHIPVSSYVLVSAVSGITHFVQIFILDIRLYTIYLYFYNIQI